MYLSCHIWFTALKARKIALYYYRLKIYHSFYWCSLDIVIHTRTRLRISYNGTPFICMKNSVVSHIFEWSFRNNFVMDWSERINSSLAFNLLMVNCTIGIFFRDLLYLTFGTDLSNSTKLLPWNSRNPQWKKRDVCSTRLLMFVLTWECFSIGKNGT